MGYMRHHAIIVTSWQSDLLEAARAEAVRIFESEGLGMLVSPVVPAAINGEGSFLVAPDGSKEGWADSDAGDRCRAVLTSWLRQQAYDDGSTSLQWVEVQFADDNGDSHIVASSDDPAAPLLDRETT